MSFFFYKTLLLCAAKTSHTCWSQPLTFEDLLLFCFIVDGKWRVLGFLTRGWRKEKKQFEDVILGYGIWHIFVVLKINRGNNLPISR